MTRRACSAIAALAFAFACIGVSTAQAGNSRGPHKCQAEIRSSVDALNTSTNSRRPPKPTLIPTFGASEQIPGGYSVQISNYDSNFRWYAKDCLRGRVSISETGLIEVTGLKADQVSSVTVKTTRRGYAAGIATSEQITAAPTVYSVMLAIAILGLWLLWHTKRQRLVTK